MKNALSVLFLLVLMLPAASRGAEEWEKSVLVPEIPPKGLASIEAPAELDKSEEKRGLPNTSDITAVYEARYGKFHFAVYIYQLTQDNKNAIQNEINYWNLKVTSRKEIKGEKYEGVEITGTSARAKEATGFLRIVRSKNWIFNIMMISETPVDAEVMAMKERYFGSFVVK